MSTSTIHACQEVPEVSWNTTEVKEDWGGVTEWNVSWKHSHWLWQEPLEYHEQVWQLLRYFKYAPVPEVDKWKIYGAKEWMEITWNITEIENIEADNDEIDELWEDLCSSWSPWLGIRFLRFLAKIPPASQASFSFQSIVV